MDRILDWQAEARLPVVDLTGGAPEMIPDFRDLLSRLREIDPAGTIIDRCNLTILLEPGNEDLAAFMARHRIEIVASMPCYSAENVNAQRGEGVFDASIAALQRLNVLGYGIDPRLPLHLVFNPNGAKLPGAQAELEADYKRELRAHLASSSTGSTRSRIFRWRASPRGCGTTAATKSTWICSWARSIRRPSQG